jgi:phosphoenolpyruvate carboxylase
VQGALRLTEQGEVIAAQYSDPEHARRGLEALVAGTLEASLAGRIEVDDDGPGPGIERWHAVLDDLAGRSQAAYRDLIYGTPGFVEWFRSATPVGEIAPRPARPPAGWRTSGPSRGCSAGPSAGSWCRAGTGRGPR